MGSETFPFPENGLKNKGTSVHMHVRTFPPPPPETALHPKNTSKENNYMKTKVSNLGRES